MSSQAAPQEQQQPQQPQQPASSGQQLAAAPAVAAAAAQNGSGRSSGCPPHVLAAIYGKQENKTAAYENSLKRWWTEYADRKNDEEEEYVADSLLYDRNHLPRTAPAPDCVTRPAAAAGGVAGGEAGAAAGGAAATAAQP